LSLVLVALVRQPSAESLSFLGPRRKELALVALPVGWVLEASGLVVEQLEG
jgi:hypothetical protein